MDDLRRLYEHQTMMAIGIYSFLDNILTQLPSNSTGPDHNADYSASQRPSRFALPLRTAELTQNLMELNRGETFRERHERIRLLPRLPNWPTPSADGNSVEPSSSGPENETGNLPRRADEVMTPPKVEVIPGGYPEEIFIYLSEREKEEYSCAVCYCVLKEAYQCQNEHRFCFGCIYTWSTGNATGHDGCPVCRCDGLYARNLELIDKINHKRARCIDNGCNWMGFIGDYLTHEHRKYTPQELDNLISTRQWQDERASFDGAVSTVVSDHGRADDRGFHMESADSLSLDETIDAGTICGVADTSNPMAVAVEYPAVYRTAVVTQPNASGPRRGAVTPQAIRNRSPFHRSNGRRSTASPNVPLRNSSRISTRISSRQPTAQPNVTGRQQSRTPIPQRTNRNTSRIGEVQTNDTRRVGRIRTRSRQRSHSRRSVPPITPELQAITTHGPLTDIDGTPEGTTEWTNDDRLLPLRTMYGSTIRECTNGGQNVDSTPGDSSTGLERELQRTSLSDRLIPQQSSIADGIGESQHPNVSISTMSPSFSLPHISHNLPLTAGRSSCPLYGTDNSSTDFMEARPQVSAEQRPNTQSNRPLEFRRLVPRRAHRVTEQLRETREQLAAMLRIMTLELEERRQQVLNAALERASRRRLLESLNTDYEQDTDREVSPSEGSRHSPSPSEARNNNMRASLNLLRNLPTPHGSSLRDSHLSPLQRLTNRLMSERMHYGESFPCTPSILDERHGMSSRDTRISTTSSSESAAEEQPSALFMPRLSSRSDHRSYSRATTPIFVVTERRTLAQLLAELRYHRTQAANRLSSEDDSTDDTEDDQNYT